MKAYTASDLNSVLDSELVWRRRELTSLVTLIQSVDSVSSAALIRAAVPLLYAHWEGFGKACGSRYLEFVSYRSKKYRELKPSFLYLSTSSSMKEIVNSSPVAGISLVQDLFQKLEEVNRNPFKKRINTKSNLRFDVLLDILSICGIDSKPFAVYESFINNEICDPRNEIAHGAGGAPSFSTFLKRRNAAFSLMEHLQSEIVNAAANRDYLLKT